MDNPWGYIRQKNRADQLETELHAQKQQGFTDSRERQFIDLRRRYNRLVKALRQIASCESHHVEDVVSIARKVLKQVDAEVPNAAR